MRKIVIIVILFVVVCFIIPIIFTNKTTKDTSKEINDNVEKISNYYDYKEYSKIKLLHTSTGEIQQLPLDEYLYGVVCAEMPALYEKEALKAQAIVARTYTIYKIKNNNKKHEEADICDDSKCCQAWISKEDRFEKWEETSRQSNWDKIVECVDSTKGKIITYNGEPINAFFHSNSGGITETTADVWGGQRISLFTINRNIRRRCI